MTHPKPEVQMISRIQQVDNITAVFRGSLKGTSRLEKLESMRHQGRKKVRGKLVKLICKGHSLDTLVLLSTLFADQPTAPHYAPHIPDLQGDSKSLSTDQNDYEYRKVEMVDPKGPRSVLVCKNCEEKFGPDDV